MRHTNKSSSLEPNVSLHLACERAQREKVRVCADGEVFSVHLSSRSWQLPLSGRETPETTKNLRSAQDYEQRLGSSKRDNG